MIWLIYGANGWIGGMVYDWLINQCLDDTVVAGNARVDDEEAVRDELVRVRPDRVLSFIGRTHGPGFSTIDYLEQQGKLVENVRDNLYAPVALALLCKELGIHFTYLGTGCIFNTDSENPIFDDNDLPNFFGSSYSTVKGFTDRVMHLLSDTTLNLRIRMPIVGYHHPRNFITKIVNYAKICSIPNSMTVLDDMIPIIVHLAGNRVTGTFNLTNPGVIEHNEILEMYKKHVDPEKTWENFTIEEQDQVLLSKRSNNHLATDKLEKYCEENALLLPTIHDSISLLMELWVGKH